MVFTFRPIAVLSKACLFIILSTVAKRLLCNHQKCRDALGELGVIMHSKFGYTPYDDDRQIRNMGQHDMMRPWSLL
jgi:hypothetical protein